MKLSGEVRAGKLVIPPVSWAIAMREHEGKRVTVEIDADKPLRTLRANARYWTVLVPLAGDLLQRKQNRLLPYSKEQVHFILKSAFLGCEENPLGGPPVPKDSHTLTTPEFYTYTEEIAAWLTQEGYPVPDSAEVSA